MTSPLRVLVVAHTHWDREWYHPAGRFRPPARRPRRRAARRSAAARESFLLDGQAIVLDDYLAVRPERRAEALGAASRRPPRGGALVRARRRADSRAEKRSYATCSPGATRCVRCVPMRRPCSTVRTRSDIPPRSRSSPSVSVCVTIVVWRGYGGARWPPGDAARWRAPSGAEAVLYHLAPDGYELGSSLPDRADRRRASAGGGSSDVLAPRATLGVALLPNGADHHARQRDQREALAALRRRARARSRVRRELAARIRRRRAGGGARSRRCR